MLGRESAQHSFLDAAWSAESLLEEGDFYGTLYREGPRLYPDDFFAECYTVDNGRPSVPPSRMMKLMLLQHWEGLSERRGFLNAVVSEARTLLTETRGDQAASAEVSEAARLLARILCQDLEPVPGEDVDDQSGDGDSELELLSEPLPAAEGEGEGAEEAAQEPVLAPGQEVRIRRGVASCPAGRTTSRIHRRGEGSQFVFDGAQCAASALRTRCTSKAPEKMRATGLGRVNGRTRRKGRHTSDLHRTTTQTSEDLP